MLEAPAFIKEDGYVKENHRGDCGAWLARKRYLCENGKAFCGSYGACAVQIMFRKRSKRRFGNIIIPKERCFDSAESLLKEERLADILFICTMDKQHYGHAIPALEKGYHLLLEKPVSPIFLSAVKLKRRRNDINGMSWCAMFCATRRFTEN